jgi:ABC-type Fe3+/spermidine/putrescine transport system ATPase subunit
MADSILHFQNVSKRFQGQLILDDLNLEMRNGEFLTLLGPSGCGKTTSLNLVAGLIQPDEGTIFLRGNSVNDVPPRRRGLGLVFQSWALFPHLSVFDNVAYGLRIRSVPSAEITKRVTSMLDLVRLPGAEQKFPSQLSGGMQQRVALARALVTRPDLLLLDEPLSNLDAALRKEMQVELRRIHSELNVSTLLVTHSQEEALVMSDRIAVMRRGKIESIATPGEIYNRPPNKFVCSFVGDANFLECKVDALGGSEVSLDCDDTRLTMLAKPGLSVGQRLTVAVRPESVALARPNGAKQSGDIEAHVADAIFKGSQIEYVVNVRSRKIHALTLPPAGGDQFKPGDKVWLRIAPSSVIPMAADEVGHG